MCGGHQQARTRVGRWRGRRWSSLRGGRARRVSRESGPMTGDRSGILRGKGADKRNAFEQGREWCPPTSAHRLRELRQIHWVHADPFSSLDEAQIQGSRRRGNRRRSITTINARMHCSRIDMFPNSCFV